MAAAERVLEKALGALLSMRRDEGQALERDLSIRLEEIESGSPRFANGFRRS